MVSKWNDGVKNYLSDYEHHTESDFISKSKHNSDFEMEMEMQNQEREESNNEKESTPLNQKVLLRLKSIQVVYCSG